MIKSNADWGGDNINVGINLTPFRENAIVLWRGDDDDQKVSPAINDEGNEEWIAASVEITPVPIMKYLWEVGGYRAVSTQVPRQALSIKKLLDSSSGGDPGNYRLLCEPNDSRLPLTLDQRKKFSTQNFKLETFALDHYANPKLQLPMPDIRCEEAYVEFTNGTDGTDYGKTLYVEQRGPKGAYFAGVKAALWDWAYKRMQPTGSTYSSKLKEALKGEAPPEEILLSAAPALILEFEVLRSMLYQTNPDKFRRQNTEYTGLPGDTVKLV